MIREDSAFDDDNDDANGDVVACVKGCSRWEGRVCRDDAWRKKGCFSDFIVVEEDSMVRQTRCLLKRAISHGKAGQMDNNRGDSRMENIEYRT